MTDRSSPTPYTEFALPLYQDRDPAHNADHIQRLLRRLERLSIDVEPPPRPWMLYFLATFHGLGARIDRQRDFREEVQRFLTDLGWTRSEITEALTQLRRHCLDPRTAEERIVHDANYLEVLGAFGVAKAFTKGGAEGQSYEQTILIFEQNLARVEFRTPHGQAAATEGRAYARAFLDQLRLELRS